MITISGYQLIREIYVSSRTLVYQGQRKSDQKPVIIKIMREDYPSFNQIIQFRNQYTITKNLDIPGVIQPYGIEKCGNALALVMEDFGGISLKEYTASHLLNLSEFLTIAIQITTLLEELHKRRIIHKDIKPANLLINPKTKQIKITDFSISSLLPKETQVLLSPNVLEGTLTYISPEQTGRMNRGIDYRSDFYSLGVTFYELLTGQLPFTTTDPMELIHSHIAKQPLSVNSQQLTVNREKIPQIVADIVIKLMAKMAEDRYQSALGLKHDLEFCYEQWQNTGQIANFNLAKRDISDRFIIPEKLYGRKLEVQTLLAAFERVSASTTELMLVAGYSGIGKTAVVNEIHKPILRQRGYFIKGKFDQFQRNIPFSAFLQAFRDLIGQLLSESEPQVEQWKTKILDALGENGQVIIDVIPEVQFLIGKQQTVLQIEGSASQNRFNLVFQKFIKAFPNSEHPLVMFLDDLQWADAASLKLIELLLCETNTPYLFLIGAYRDNEVFPGHPLAITLDEIRKSKAVINTITLTPLSETNLNHLIADTLSCPEKIASPLTELIYKKTKGNPFFSNQFLKSLYEDGLIDFNFEARYWQCDIAKVRALALTDDVVEFMALQLQKLPENTQSVMKLAACIGNYFDLSTLAIVREKSLAETAADLWTALQEGLIVPTSEVYKFFHEPESIKIVNSLNELSIKYKFLHDRVYQAAYFLIPENDKKAIHLKIGRLLLSNTPVEERKEKIFDIINQLNIGIDSISDKAERDLIAQLNLLAGRKAKIATAYAAAAKYLDIGLKMLTASSWETQYDLTLALSVEATEVAYLSTDFQQMKELALIVLENAKSMLDRVKVYEVQIQAYAAQNKQLEAIETALSVLKVLGVDFPELPNHIDIQLALSETKANLAEKSLEDWCELPEMTDFHTKAAMRLLSSIISSAFQAAPVLLPLIVSKQINLSIKYGNSSESPFAYAMYGATLAGIIGDIEEGYKIGKLAVSLLEKLKAKEFQSKTIFVVNCCINHWQEPISQTLKPLLNAYSIGLENGDLEYAALALYIHSYHSYFKGEELDQLEQDIASSSAAIDKIKQTVTLGYQAMAWQAVSNWLGQTENPCDLIGKNYDKQTMLPIHIESNDITSLYYLNFHELILCYWFNQEQMAVEKARLAEEYLHGVTGLAAVPILYFYDSLAQLSVYDKSTKAEQENILLKVAANQEKIKNWSTYAAGNYLHKFYLVEAERHRVLGEKVEAMEMYDRAIDKAKENQYVQEEGLANELAAKFYLQWGKEKFSRTYMIEAYYCYTRWGAKAKIDGLEKRYPQLLTPIPIGQKKSFNIGQTIEKHTVSKVFNSTTSNITEFLDFSSVNKASQALYGEIHLDKLLAKIMQIVLENGGAEKACLILPKSGNLAIEATAICGNVNGQIETISLLQSIPVYCTIDNPAGMINYVQRTQETIVIDDARNTTCFASDPYIIQHQPKSILCTPLLNQGKLIGILYLENNLITGAFTSDRLEILKVLCSQAAISLENARLYQESQNYAKQLEEYVKKLEQAQIQIVQSEKMATLGQLMSGISHEINNPVGFIASNINHIFEYTQELLKHLEIYQRNYPKPVSEVTENAVEIDLEFLMEDLPQLISSMKEGTDRISHISNSMRTFSRADTASKTPFNIDEGIDSTLLILRHRLKANSNRPEIEIIKNYAELPRVNCYPGQLNQVFMNLLANAIEALEESNQGKSYREIQNNPNQITITTEMAKDGDRVMIRIADNGVGMAEELQERIFDYLFTTKPVGKGTGMGLSISRQIVEKQHGGELTCSSLPGKGTEFAIAIPV